MVYFEGIGLINEKPPIVIEIGRRYSRCGVSGDSFPYGLVPTRPSLFEDETRFHADRTSGQLQLSLIDFIQNELCAQTLLLSLKDRQIVIVESVLGSSDFREALAEVFFNHFEVASVLFCPSHSAALYPLGLTSALVVDIGFKETTIVPVIQGYVVLKAWQALPMATSALHKRLAEELSRCDVLKAESLEGEEEDKSVLKEKLTPSVLEDVQVRCCFITTRERKQKLESGEEIKFPPDVYYPLDGLTTLVIPGKVREFAGEALFECDEDGNTTNSSILRCILDSPIDARKDLLENILVIGGTAEMNGLKDRLMDELRSDLAVNGPFKDHLSQIESSIKLHIPPTPSNYIAWLGGAIIGATSVPQLRATSREHYKKLGRIPDWCDMRDNQRSDSESDAARRR